MIFSFLLNFATNFKHVPKNLYKFKNNAKSLDAFISRLEKIKNHISKNEFDLLEKQFEEAHTNRNEIPRNAKGFLSRLYDIFVFVKDEPGAINKISSVLFKNDINIKDIELLKIREGTGGTFRLSFETIAEKEKAEKLLKGIAH